MENGIFHFICADNLKVQECFGSNSAKDAKLRLKFDKVGQCSECFYIVNFLIMYNAYEELASKT